MSSRTAVTGTKTTGQTVTTANFNDGAGGWIGYVAVTSSQGSITTITDLTSLSQAVTVNTSRRIRITGWANFSSDVAEDDAGLRIFEGATQLAAATVHCHRTTASYTAVVQCVLTPSAASHTYKLAGIRQAGTGNVSMDASSTNPAFILIEDIGPA